MPLFMILSGYIFAMEYYKKEDVNKWMLIKRWLISYGIPFVVFSFVWNGSKILFSSQTYNPVTYMDFLKMFLYPAGVMWFIYALLIMKIVQVLVGCVTNKNKTILLMVGLILFFTRAYIINTYPNLYFDGIIFNYIMQYYIYFLVGCYFLEDTLNFCKQKIVLSIVLFALTIGTVYLIHKGKIGEGTTMTLAIGMGGLSVILFSELINRQRILECLGKHSMVIYLLHCYILVVMRIFFVKLELNDKIGFIPLIAGVLLGVIIPLGIYWLSKKMKLDFVFYPYKYLKKMTKN